MEYSQIQFRYTIGTRERTFKTLTTIYGYINNNPQNELEESFLKLEAHITNISCNMVDILMVAHGHSHGDTKEQVWTFSEFGNLT